MKDGFLCDPIGPERNLNIWVFRDGGTLDGRGPSCLSKSGRCIFSVKEDTHYEDNPFGFVLRCWDVSRG